MPESLSSLGNQFHALLGDWVSSGAYQNALRQSFGNGHSSAIDDLQNILQDSWKTRLPAIVEVTQDLLGYHSGAYSADTNTIYVDGDLGDLPGFAAQVLAHELGHWVDYQLHGSFSDHRTIANFANLLVGNQQTSGFVHDDQQDVPPSVLSPSGTIVLPSGQEIQAQFFDTPLHVEWIGQTLPFLSEQAKATVALAQEDTDYFYGDPSWSPGSWVTFGGLKYSYYGLQTQAASHFDNNDITAGLLAIRSRYEDGIKRFNDTKTPDITSTTVLRKYHEILAARPFDGPDAGVKLLLYRFGQIAHALEDFYSHSNWIETISIYNGSNPLVIPAGRILESGLDLPVVYQAGDVVPGTSVRIVNDSLDWSKYLKKSGTGSYSGKRRDVYWNVDSRGPWTIGGSIVSGITPAGQTLYGLMTGATSGALYKDPDRSVFLRDPAKTGAFQKEYFRGFDHGGLAGTIYGQWVGPLNKDKLKRETVYFHGQAKKYAILQIQNEWDRIGNLINKNYGTDGLKKFANLALSSPAERDKYVALFSSPGARYFPQAPKLSFSAALAKVDTVDQDFTSNTADAVENLTEPEVRPIMVFNKSVYNPASPFSSYQVIYQFKDAKTGAWVDSDFNAFSIHHELSSDDILRLTTASKVQHVERGERAAWQLSNDNQLNSVANDFFVETANQNIPVYIDNFDLVEDRIVLVDANGKETRLPEYLYSSPGTSGLTSNLEKYNIFINFRPDIKLVPETFVVKSSQLNSPLVLDAALFAGDAKQEKLYFAAYDGSIPFLTLVDGTLQTKQINSNYVGETYTAFVDVTDGVSTARSVPIRIAVEPQIKINNTAFKSDALFSLKFNGITSQSRQIFSQIADSKTTNNDIFLPLVTSIGSANGLPHRYTGLDSIVQITDRYDTGVVSFWLQDGPGDPKALTVKELAGNAIGLYLGLDEIAQMRPLTTTIPQITYASTSEGLSGYGLKLNQAETDKVIKNDASFWTASLSVELFQESEDKSRVGLVLADIRNGGVLDPLTGLSLDPSSSDWFQNAISSAVWLGDSRQGRSARVSHSESVSFKLNGRIDPDSVLVVPFIETRVNDQVFTYSSFDALNPDGGRHVEKLALNVFGFESTPGQSENDFDNIIMKINSFTLA